MPQSKPAGPPRAKTALQLMAGSDTDIGPVVSWWRDPEKLMARAFKLAERNPALQTRLRARIGRLAERDAGFRRELEADLKAIPSRKVGRDPKPLWVKAALVGAIEAVTSGPEPKFRSKEAALRHFSELWGERSNVMPELAISFSRMKALYYEARRDPKVSALMAVVFKPTI